MSLNWFYFLPGSLAIVCFAESSRIQQSEVLSHVIFVLVYQKVFVASHPYVFPSHRFVVHIQFYIATQQLQGIIFL